MQYCYCYRCPGSPKTAVPVRKLYYQRAKIQLAAEDGRSSTAVVLPENENPAGRQRRPFQCESCTSKEQKSSWPPETAVPVRKLPENENPAGRRRRPFQCESCQRTKIQLAAGDSRSSTKAVLPESEIQLGLYKNHARLRYMIEGPKHSAGCV